MSAEIIDTSGNTEWSPERVADLFEQLNTGHQWLLYQLDLIAGQQAVLSKVLIRQIGQMVADYQPADAARTQLATLTAEQLFAGLDEFITRRSTAPAPEPRLSLFQLHRGGRP